MNAQISTGDTARISVCCSLVLLMTSTLDFFYGRRMRRKNVLPTLTMSYTFMSLIGLQRLLYGSSHAFGPDIVGFTCGLDFPRSKGVGAQPNVRSRHLENTDAGRRMELEQFRRKPAVHFDI